MRRIHLETLVVSFMVIPAVLTEWLDIDQVPVLENPSDNVNILVVTRHGMYTPAPCELDGHKNLNFGEDGPLQLTEKSQKLMQLVGKILMRRYEEHFRLMYHKRFRASGLIKVTATEKEIARQSALHIIKGIKEQKPGMAWKFSIDLSTENIEKNEYFDPRLLREQEVGRCKSFEEIAKKLKNPTEVSAKSASGDNVQNVFLQYDYLQMEKLEGLRLPDWTKTKKGQSKINDMKKDANRRLNNLIGGDISYWKFFVSTMLENILVEFKISSLPFFPGEIGKRIPRLHLHVVDDNLMAALVRWLRLELSISANFGSKTDVYYPQVGDSLILEMDDKLVVRVFYLRTVEESGSQTGLKELYLEDKMQEWPWSRVPVREGVSAWLFHTGLLRNGLEWRACCIEQNFLRRHFTPSPLSSSSQTPSFAALHSQLSSDIEATLTQDSSQTRCRLQKSKQLAYV